MHYTFRCPTTLMLNSFALAIALALVSCGGGDAPGNEAALGSGTRTAAPETSVKGNSDAAHRCQNGGYNSLVGADGESFSNAGQCVSFVAKGGKFLPTFPPRYDVIRIAPHGYTADINNLGQVVGLVVETDSTQGSPQYGFLYHEGRIINLSALNNNLFTGPTAINDRGVVVGAYSPFGQEWRGFVYEAGELMDLHTAVAIPYAINNRGQIVGAAATTGFLLQPPRTIIDLGTLPGGQYSLARDINDRGQIVGDSWADPYALPRAFLYSGGVMVDLGIGPSSPMAINDRGQIVGSTYSDVVFGESRAFLYSEGVLTRLEGLPGVTSPSDAALSINSSGQIAGNAVGPYPNNSQYGVLWIEGKPVKLNDLVDVSQGWHIQNPKINDYGDIAADGCILNECSIPLLLKVRPREP